MFHEFLDTKMDNKHICLSRLEEAAGTKLTEKLKDKKLLQRDITQKQQEPVRLSTTLVVIHLAEI